MGQGRATECPLSWNTTMLNALPVILTIRDYALLEDLLHYDNEPFPGW